VLEVGDSIRLKCSLLVSVCAGISTDQLSSWFGSGLPIARVMPNTPSLLQSGAAGMFANRYLAKQQKSIVEKIFRASGVAIWVEKEDLMDVICSISGSGPAYFFLFMEILADLGHEFGLNSDDSKLLATQTAYGASRMALESESNDLEGLRIKVTSKGGTTEAAISTLEIGGIRGIIKSAIINNIKRGKELSELSQGSPKLLS
jgi:pyrroline-5-carboxylate reductase